MKKSLLLSFLCLCPVAANAMDQQVVEINSDIDAPIAYTCSVCEEQKESARELRVSDLFGNVDCCKRPVCKVCADELQSYGLNECPYCAEFALKKNVNVDAVLLRQLCESALQQSQQASETREREAKMQNELEAKLVKQERLVRQAIERLDKQERESALPHNPMAYIVRFDSNISPVQGAGGYNANWRIAAEKLQNTHKDKLNKSFNGSNRALSLVSVSFDQPQIYGQNVLLFHDFLQAHALWADYESILFTQNWSMNESNLVNFLGASPQIIFATYMNKREVQELIDLASVYANESEVKDIKLSRLSKTSEENDASDYSSDSPKAYITIIELVKDKQKFFEKQRELYHVYVHLDKPMFSVKLGHLFYDFIANHKEAAKLETSWVSKRPTEERDPIIHGYLFRFNTYMNKNEIKKMLHECNEYLKMHWEY